MIKVKALKRTTLFNKQTKKKEFGNGQWQSAKRTKNGRALFNFRETRNL
jgi:hypothetical protein